ncbi:CHAT domain-containing protein [Streptomyces albofaciens JCM 4342]|uniref:CHAT domain-containing protein n=1 Tax=Streptomyces albofaciens TaxID=66866 RepID=UPI00123C713E|nr:CHAT domain-containing protein [Streptomyces albofaciens]KAA6223726.1 CHAT domain-containing protein [Streptomyces albofaciens JCM 4342]
MGGLPFRLDVFEVRDEWVIMCTSPLGRASAKVRPPYGPDELRLMLSEVRTALIRSASPVITRRASLVEKSVRDFGERLSDTVLTGDIRLLFDRCREHAGRQGEPLRVVLGLDGPQVSGIPWEFAIDPYARDSYLGLRVPVVRSPQLMGAPAPVCVTPPLRVLGVISRPTDLPTLQSERERDEITQALQRLSTDVAVDWLHGDSWRELAEAVRTRAPHVLHFVGHGGFDTETGSGYLELSAEDGTAMHVSGTDLGRLMHDSPQLRLVVLNACESATSGAEGVFSSTAAKIMREGVPAVVAMQYEITDPAALAFAPSFYTGMARGLPVDRAMTLARESVKMTLPGSLEWATPVLFLRSDETQLFVVPEQPEQPEEPGQTRQSRQPGQGAEAAGTPGPAGQTAPSGAGERTVPPSATTGDLGSLASGRTVPRRAPGPGSPPDRPAAQPPPYQPPPATEQPWAAGVREKFARYIRARPDTPRPGPAPGASAAPADRTVPPQPTAPPATAAPSAASTAPPSYPPPVFTSRSAGRPRTPGLLPGLGPCSQAALGPRGLLAAACLDGSLRVFRLDPPQLLAECAARQHGPVLRLAWSPWPRNLATLHESGTTVVWDIETEVPVRTLPGRAGQTGALAFSGDGRWLATAGGDRVQVHDANGRTVRSLPVAPAPLVPCLAFGPGDRHLLAGTADGAVRRLDVHGRTTAQWPHPQPVCAIAACADRLATGSPDGRVRAWAWSGRLLHRVHQGGAVRELAFAPDGAVLAAASDDGVLVRWDRDGTPRQRAELAGRPVGVACTGRDGAVLTATDDGVVEIHPGTTVPTGPDHPEEAP